MVVMGVVGVVVVEEIALLCASLSTENNKGYTYIYITKKEKRKANWSLNGGGLSFEGF